MKINELAQPRRSQGAAAVFESYFGGLPVDRLSHRQARHMLGRVRGMLAEHRSTRDFHMSENNPAYLKLVMLEGVLRQKLNEDDATAAAGMMNPSSPEAKKAMQDQAAKVKQAQMQQINKVKDPNIKNALSSAIQGKSMNPDQQQALANAALASGAVAEGYSDKNPKFDIHVDGEYKASTNWAKTAKEAKAKWLEKHPGDANKKISISRATNESRVDELSKDTLKSYAKKASRSHGARNFAMADAASRNDLPALRKANRDVTKRQKGIDRAIDRLANESIRHSLRRALTESELNQAQVTLAAKDMSDRVQKMLEDASSMQFKDLPALVDEIRSEVGVPQSGQYSQQVGEILGTLVQAIQQAKSGLDGAMGIVTGQEMSVPGEEGADLSGAAPAPEMGAVPPEGGMEMPPEGGMEMPPEPVEEPGAEAPGALGRERR